MKCQFKKDGETCLFNKGGQCENEIWVEVARAKPEAVEARKTCLFYKVRPSINRFQRTGVTHPKDIIHIIHQRGTISDSIICRLDNVGEEYSETFSLRNRIQSWKFLKEFNEMGGRKVMYDTDIGESINFEKSAPYQQRFNCKPAGQK